MLLAASEVLNIKSGHIPQIASALGAGLCYRGEICGIITGGLLIIGLIHGRENPYDDNSTAYQMGRKYQEEFEKLAGTMNCRDITGCDFNREEDRQYFDEKIQGEVCLPLLIKAAKVLNEILIKK